MPHQITYIYIYIYVCSWFQTGPAKHLRESGNGLKPSCSPFPHHSARGECELVAFSPTCQVHTYLYTYISLYVPIYGSDGRGSGSGGRGSGTSRNAVYERTRPRRLCSDTLFIYVIDFVCMYHLVSSNSPNSIGGLRRSRVPWT